MIRALAFFGAFNPITIAHLNMAYKAYRKLNYDKVILVPSKHSYIAEVQNKKYVFSDFKRLTLLNDVAKSKDWLEICDYEINNDYQPKTYETLKYLSTKYQVELLVGSDKILEFEEKWVNTDKIFKEFGVVVIERNGDDVLKIINNNHYLKEYRSCFKVIHRDDYYHDISSSKLRSYILNDELLEAEKLLPNEINYLLKEHKMKNTFIKVAVVNNASKISNVEYNTLKIIDIINHHDDSIMVFPELSLTGYSCADLFNHDFLIEQALKSLIKLKAVSLKHPGRVFIVGLPYRYNHNLYNCAAIINEGKIVALVPKNNIPNYDEFYEGRYFKSGQDLEDVFVEIDGEAVFFGNNVIIRDKTKQILLGVEICEDLWSLNRVSDRHRLNGANIIANLSASNETVNKYEVRRSLVQNQSYGCCYMYASSGSDESSTDLVFSGHLMLSKDGKMVKEKLFSNPDEVLSTIIDLASFKYYHQSFDNKATYLEININLLGNEAEISVDKLKTLLKNNYQVDRMPFIFNEKKEALCLKTIHLQARGLATRLNKTGIKKVVIGVSGGLDSTLALLVCDEAKKLIPELKIIAYTMPKKGNTSSTTLKNAVALMDILADEKHTIEIEDQLNLHLKELNHTHDVFDVTYENAQARIRTLILMDAANMYNALVIGTGDMSELALGFCTYNGDHMSMYAVNASIPKTLIPSLCKSYANNKSNKLLSVIEAICNTPISPELIPNINDKIAQKTEEKIGKYELNDFFMYYFLKYNYSPKKMLLLAMLAFDDLDKETIKKAEINFLKRFFSQQFKRSCMPDGPKVLDLSLSPRGDLRMSSDSDVLMWLDDLILA